MNTDQKDSGVAQPAEEELKKHGDQLKKQVKDAAGRQLKGKGDEKDEEALND